VLVPPDFSLLVIMLCFWLIYVVVRTQLVKPLGAVLDEREQHVREAQTLLAEARESFDSAMTRCEREIASSASEAQAGRQALRDAGEAVRRATVEAARAAGQTSLAALQKELDVAAAEARGALRERSRLLAVELASRLVGRRIAS